MNKPDKILFKRIIKISLLAACFLMPLLINYLVLFINGYGLTLNNLLLYMNDEVYWHAQTAAAVQYGMPAGYFGYNGSYAKIGTFNTWGPFPFIPYVICGKIFGAGIYSRHIFNIFFIALALVLFMILVKADNKTMAFLICLFSLMPLNSAYLLTSMSEPERFAIAIILAGIFVRLVKFETGPIFKYFITPVVILGSSFIYYLFLIFIPLYIFIIFEKKKILERIIISAAIFAAVGATVLYITSIMSSPYNIRSGLSDSVNRIMFYLTSGEDLFQSVKGIFRVFWGNLAHFGPVNLINISYFENGFCSVYIAGFELTIAVSCLFLIFNRKNRDALNKVFIFLYVSGCFIMAFALLYAEEPLTVVRGLNCAWLFLVFFYTASKQKPLRYGHLFEISQIIIILIVFISGISFINSVCYNEYTAAQKTVHIMYEKDRIENVMKVNTDSNRWNNTIAYYGDLSTEYLEIPDGFGLNYMTEYGIDDRMGWAVVNKKDNKIKKDIYEKLDDHYNVIYENDDFCIMRNISL